MMSMSVKLNLGILEASITRNKLTRLGYELAGVQDTKTAWRPVTRISPLIQILPPYR